MSTVVNKVNFVDIRFILACKKIVYPKVYSKCHVSYAGLPLLVLPFFFSRVLWLPPRTCTRSNSVIHKERTRECPFRDWKMKKSKFQRNIFFPRRNHLLQSHIYFSSTRPTSWTGWKIGPSKQGPESTVHSSRQSKSGHYNLFEW